MTLLSHGGFFMAGTMMTTSNSWWIDTDAERADAERLAMTINSEFISKVITQCIFGRPNSSDIQKVIESVVSYLNPSLISIDYGPMRSWDVLLATADCVQHQRLGPGELVRVISEVSGDEDLEDYTLRLLACHLGMPSNATTVHAYEVYDNIEYWGDSQDNIQIVIDALLACASDRMLGSLQTKIM